jgi:hypothetical protein
MAMKSFHSSCIALVVAFVLGGCASQPTDSTATADSSLPEPALGNVEYHTYVLANELFANLRPSSLYRYAVAGFVPVDSMVYDATQQHPLRLLGHQLEQGLMTEATKRGFVTQEFKLSRDIIMSDDADRVLTRDLDRLSELERIDFFITGTLVYQEAGAMVNARVINAKTKDVVAAATRFFPAQLFWEEEQVTIRAGRLYRTEDKG